MNAGDITDRETLQTWLQGRSREDAVAIAQRTALRVLPLAARATGGVFARKVGLTVRPILRCLLTSEVASQNPTPEIRRAAADAAAAATISAAYAADSANAKVAIGPNSDYAAAARAAVYADAARGAAASYVRAAADAAISATSIDADAVDGDYIWEQIREDARMVEIGADLLSTRLWSDGQPDWFQRADNQMRAVLRADDPENRDFWVRWWDGVLSGQQMDWKLQEAVALIPDEVWEQGPSAVAEATRELGQTLALARTDNAEALVPNPETGRLRIVATSNLPESAERRARRAMAGIARLFGEGTANQHRALLPDLEMLATTAADTEATPVELFDTCASASRRLRVRIANGECPSADQDALVQDYGSRLINLAADILSSDPETQEVLNRRNAIKGNDAMIEGREAITHAVALALPVVEGRLEVALKVDLDIAVNPKSDPEERRTASPLLAGRILRIVLIAAAGVGGIGSAIIAAPRVLEAYRELVADPLVRQAIEFIMRYLGL